MKLKAWDMHDSALTAEPVYKIAAYCIEFGKITEEGNGDEKTFSVSSTREGNKWLGRYMTFDAALGALLLHEREWLDELEREMMQHRAALRERGDDCGCDQEIGTQENDQ